MGIIYYNVDHRGALQTKCPHGRKCLVGGGECTLECEFFIKKSRASKYIKCRCKTNQD